MFHVEHFNSLYEEQEYGPIVLRVPFFGFRESEPERNRGRFPEAIGRENAAI
jgi:hypothetical protein